MTWIDKILQALLIVGIFVFAGCGGDEVCIRFVDHGHDGGADAGPSQDAQELVGDAGARESDGGVSTDAIDAADAKGD